MSIEMNAEAREKILVEERARADYEDGRDFMKRMPNDPWDWEDLSEQDRESWREAARATLHTEGAQ